MRGVSPGQEGNAVDCCGALGQFGSMKSLSTTLIFCLVLSGCSFLPSRPDAPSEIAGEDTIRPKPRPPSFAPLPPEDAVTLEDFDTTSGAERAAAADASADEQSEEALGLTIAALGSPTQPGFWLETPLVSTRRPGRVVAVVGGTSVLVELLPIDGPEGAGSRISLAALRLLNVGLTGLHELQVFGR